MALKSAGIANRKAVFFCRCSVLFEVHRGEIRRERLGLFVLVQLAIYSPAVHCCIGHGRIFFCRRATSLTTLENQFLFSVARVLSSAACVS